MAHRGYLIDTNVISELRKPRPNSSVLEWVDAQSDGALFLSVITVGEIAKGTAKRRRAKDGRHAADALQAWLEGLLATYADRIIPVDVPIAASWGRLCDAHPQLATDDMLLAATALDRTLTIATRNVEHFQIANVPVVNPFQ
jgi:predicted nucleic acid-binding protein